MNIYKLTNKGERNGNYFDYYDSCVVQATSEKKAKLMSPAHKGCLDEWCLPEDVAVELLGTSTNNRGTCILLSSFNAG